MREGFGRGKRGLGKETGCRGGARRSRRREGGRESALSPTGNALMVISGERVTFTGMPNRSGDESTVAFVRSKFWLPPSLCSDGTPQRRPSFT